MIHDNTFTLTLEVNQIIYQLVYPQAPITAHQQTYPLPFYMTTPFLFPEQDSLTLAYSPFNTQLPTQPQTMQIQSMASNPPTNTNNRASSPATVIRNITSRHPNLNLNDIDNLEAMASMEAMEIENMMDMLPEDIYTEPLINLNPQCYFKQ